MSPYLLAIVITDYSPVVEVIYKRDDNSSVLMRFWLRKGYPLEWMDRSVEVAPRILKYLENLVQQPYSLPKLDLMAFPEIDLDFSGIGNWGLIIFQ